MGEYVISGKYKVAPKEVERRGKVKIIYFIDKRKLPPSALENLEKIINALEEKGYPFKVIEVDSVAGYYLRGVRRGRFIPLSMMHLARLLKR